MPAKRPRDEGKAEEKSVATAPTALGVGVEPPSLDTIAQLAGIVQTCKETAMMDQAICHLVEYRLFDVRPDDESIDTSKWPEVSRKRYENGYQNQAHEVKQDLRDEEQHLCDTIEPLDRAEEDLREADLSLNSSQEASLDLI